MLKLVFYIIEREGILIDWFADCKIGLLWFN